MARPRCVLLDAGPVIFLHARGVWEQFCRVFDVVIPEIVADNEAIFHSRDELTGGSEPILIREEERAGRVSVVAATSAELATTIGLYSDDFAEALHEGEIEGIALMTQRDQLDECVFCTGDGAAIQAAVMVGLNERCLSLEALLESSGLRQDMPKALSRTFFDFNHQEGAKNRVSGFGLRR